MIQSALSPSRGLRSLLPIVPPDRAPRQGPLGGRESSACSRPFRGLAALLLVAASALLTQSARASLEDGLVGYWSMDSVDIDWASHTILDRSGNGNTGKLIGVTSAPGRYGEALQFNGDATKIEIAGSQSLNLRATNRCTYSIWLKLSEPSVNWESVLYHTRIQQLAIQQGQVIFRPGFEPYQVVAYKPAPLPLITGTWYHIAAVYDGVNGSIFVNGVASAFNPPGKPGGIIASVSSLTIGGGATLHGALDEIRIYNRALAADEIAQLFSAASFPTDPLPVPAAPSGFQAAERATDSLTLSWTRNSDQDVTGYALYRDGAVAAEIGADATTLVVPNLSQGTQYSFELAARNRHHIEGLHTPPLQASTLGSSAAPRRVVPELSRLQISGDLTPDAAGIYELQEEKTEDGHSLWRRSDRRFCIYGIVNSRLILATDPSDAAYLQGHLEWLQTTSGPAKKSKNFSGTAELTLLEEPGFPTPAQYLASRHQPVFKPGHTLPPLTRWGWTLGYDTQIELADWGYALDLGNADDATVAALNNPASTKSKLLALALADPARYRLSVLVPQVPAALIPATAYTVDQAGQRTTTWSPEAPDAVLQDMAGWIAGRLREIQQRAPLAVILNGGERYMGVAGWDRNEWAADPRIIAAKADRTWSDYQSERKAHQELVFSNAIHEVSPAKYIWYYAGGNQYRSQGASAWSEWDWDYREMHPASDAPSTSIYYQAFNSGWTGHLNWTGITATSSTDMLSLALNAHGYAVTFDKKLSYNWLCSGWEGHAFGDIERYYGYLKSYYTAGMIGGIAGYFTYPTGGFDQQFDVNHPPNWLQQIEALAHVHGRFSHIEDMLRHGSLLPGPDLNEKNPDQPAYEFRTGHADTRVLARKLAGRKRWLISAWAADGVRRTIDVEIPILGTVRLHATPAGSLYDARIVGGVMSLTPLDDGKPGPCSITLSTSLPDPDGLTSRPTSPSGVGVLQGTEP